MRKVSLINYNANLSPRESHRPMDATSIIHYSHFSIAAYPKYEPSTRGRFISYFLRHNRGSSFSVAPEGQQSNFHAHYYGLQIQLMYEVNSKDARWRYTFSSTPSLSSGFAPEQYIKMMSLNVLNSIG